MGETDQPGRPAKGKPIGRAERLSAALRENLKRRKSQARERASAEKADDREAGESQATKPDPDREPGGA